MALDSYCRWTAWLSADVGGISDREDLPALVSKYGPYACPKPLNIKVRRVDTKDTATLKGGPQVNSDDIVLNKFFLLPCLSLIELEKYNFGKCSQ
jgi:hypothetical protein